MTLKDIQNKQLRTDTRAITDPANTVYAAVRTHLADGHVYIRDAYDMGVKCFIVERKPSTSNMADAQFILVDNVEDTLAQLAAARLRGFKGGIVITGSQGKTTLKELLFTALLPHTSVSRNPRSWNSSIGLPLAIWDMTASGKIPEIMISEAAIDAPGQGSGLAHILGDAFTIGILTPVTQEHDENFSSHAAKIKEKISILAHCDTIIYAATDPEVETLLKAHAQERESKGLETRLIPVVQGDFPDIIHALAAQTLSFLGINDEKVLSLPLVRVRRDLLPGLHGNTIICDHFTPDLRSLEESLMYLRRHAAQARTVLVLGELLHAPGLSRKEIAALYDEAAALVKEMGIDGIYSIGTEDSGAIAPEEFLRLYEHGEISSAHILAYGTADGTIGQVIPELESANHDTALEVDLDALTHNFRYYRSLMPGGSGMVAMVKANAYGLGAVEIGRTLQAAGASYLAVAVIEEGIALRQAGVSMPVILLNPVTNRYSALFANHLEPAVFSIEELECLIEQVKSSGLTEYPVHIKLDTGMHRVGFLKEDIPALARLIKGTDTVKVASVFSHLATADCPDIKDYMENQLKLFADMTEELSAELKYPFRRHILNTAGMMRVSNEEKYDMGRLGIGLYGISPMPEQDSHLRPLATFLSHIISLKHWPEGTPIGYGCRGVTARPSVIATVPVGYADGINRHLGNGNTKFLIGGVLCPTIGNICMDLCMVDVTDVEGVKVGDKVEIFGPNVSVESVAATLGTIPYEVLTSVGARIPRTYHTR